MGHLAVAFAAGGRLRGQPKGVETDPAAPPLFTEPGWSTHTAEEIGIDDFQASRSPDRRFYRTTPLRGLFTRAKGASITTVASRTWRPSASTTHAC